mgnify:CR=1 FL=1
MNDTSNEIRQKQLSIFRSMSPAERYQISIEMINTSRQIVEYSIRALRPGITTLELKREIFKRYYSNDFSVEELEKILFALR